MSDGFHKKGTFDKITKKNVKLQRSHEKCIIQYT